MAERPAPPLDDPALARRFTLVEAFAGGEGFSAAVQDGDHEGAMRLLKVLPRDADLDEVSLLASLAHAKFPRVLEVGRTAGGEPFLLREFVPGRTLDRVGTLDAAAAIVLATELLHVLAFVHLRDILHLDLKPANVLRADGDRDDDYRLLDFGMGRRGHGRARGGTPFFAAPEVRLGLDPDPRSDLFSLGAVLFVMLREQKPPLRRFLQRFPHDDFFAAAGAEPSALPPPFDAIVPRLVARRPAERYADAQDALEAFGAGSGRPSLAALALDPIAVHKAALDAAIARLADDASLELSGGDRADREALALDAACRLAGVREIRHGADTVTFVRGRREPVRMTLPPLDAATIARHLERVLGLDAHGADDAAAAIAARGADSAERVSDVLRGLARDGEIVPDGTRWTWPAALGGRLRLERAARDAPSAASLRDLAARGAIEQAIAAYAAAHVDVDGDRVLRRELVAGLLAAGEPMRALPLAHDLPVLEARALYDLGRIDAARAKLGRIDARAHADDPAYVRLCAGLTVQAGDRAAAEAMLAEPGAAADDVDGLVFRGFLLASLDRADDATACLEQALALPEAAARPFLRASAHQTLGELARRRGELAAARAHGAECLALCRSLGNVRHTATASSNLGVVAKDLGDLEDAIEHLRRARTLFEHVHDRAGAALAEANLGIVSLEAGDAESALRRLGKASAALEELGAQQWRPLLGVLQARAHAMRGDHDAARALLSRLEPSRSPRMAHELELVRNLLDIPPPPAATTRPPPDPGEPTMRTDDDTTTAAMPKSAFRTFLAINRRLASEADLQKAMTYLLEAAVTLSGAREGYLLIAHEQGLRLELSTDSDPRRDRAFSRSLANKAISQQRVLSAEDALADRELMDMPSVRGLDVKSALCVPFRSSTATAGALYVEHAGRSGVFGETEREYLEVLADQAAIAVDRMQHEADLEARLQHSQRDLEVAKRRLARQAPVKMLGKSPPMQELARQIAKFAATELPVLIHGETGTGKELVAQAIHAESHVSKGPFISENCSAIPAELIESELFGHVKGAFTGADADKAGLIELATGGTLFLDEVGDMPRDMQAKLLRALQERRIRRVGGTDTIPVQVRLVAATHRNLQAMIEAGEFRQDLYYRIAAGVIRVPPLRERGDDIRLLARSFLERQCRDHRRELRLDEAAEERLCAYSWPGNVRELDHVIARAFILSEGDALDLRHLPLPTSAQGPVASDWPVVTLQEAELRTIEAALGATGGDKSKAARILGISRTALYDKLKRHADGQGGDG